MPRFLAPITVGQETVTGTETISGNQIILSGTFGKDSYWTSVSASGGLSANHGSFVNNVSAFAYYGDASNLLNARDTTKLPLAGGILNGKLFGNDADFSNSLFSTTISAVDFIGNGSQLTNIAKLDSPAFVGIPTAPTASANTNTTQIATTQFVIENGGDRYLTTSNSTLTLNNNNNISLTAAAGLSYITGQDITIVHSPTQYINATVVSYNKTTGVMVYNGNSKQGTGTFNTWTINVGGVPAVGSLIASNNLSDVASTSAALTNLGGFPNTGGTLNGGLTGTHAQFNSVTFTPNAVNLPYQVGKVWYDTNKDALCYYNSVSGNKLHIGQEIQQYVRNATANTILKGDVVRIIGVTDQSPDVVLAQATSLSGSIITGVANQDIPSNTNGYIVTIGEVANYDTSRFFAGEDLFLSPLSAGKITNVLPTNPYFAVQVGVCMYSHETNGKLLVYTQYLGTAANTVVGTLSVEQLPIIPISGGGTGKTTAADGLSSLGGFPITGGTINGGLTANSGTFTTSISSPSISGTYYGDGSRLIGVIPSFQVDGRITQLTGTLSGNTFTNSVTGALSSVDGYAFAAGDSLIWYFTGTNAGLWTVTSTGSPTTSAVLTRPSYYQGTLPWSLAIIGIEKSGAGGNQGLWVQLRPNTSGTYPVVVNTTNMTTNTVINPAGNASISGNSFQNTQTLVAGTNTVAPLKFQSGVLQTTPAAHSIEWNGNSLYATTSAATRTAIPSFIAGPLSATGTVPVLSSTNGIAGQMAFDSNYLYICTAANTWKRTSLSAW